MKMFKITKNKHGFVASSIVLLICFVTFCIVGFIFYILFSFTGKLSVYDIRSDSQSLSANYVLLSYLRTPVEVNGNKINMADLIILSVNEDDYDDLIKNTEEILGKEGVFYSIIIYDKAKYDAVEKGEKFHWTPGSIGLKVDMHSEKGIVSDDRSLTEVAIPNPNEEIPLIQIVFLYSTGREATEQDQIWKDFETSSGV